MEISCTSVRMLSLENNRDDNKGNWLILLEFMQPAGYLVASNVGCILRRIFSHC